MRYVIETRHPDAETTKREARFYGFYAFRETAEYRGAQLTHPEAYEAGREYEVHEVSSAGPKTQAEWLFKVRREIERQFNVVYDVDDDSFLKNVGHDAVYDVSAQAAYKGAKIAMQLLEVQ